MRFSLLPRVITEKLEDLTPGFFQERGIRLLMLDFDNTIVPYTTSTPTQAMDAWLKQMLASRIQLCVVSNSKRDRVKIFCQKYGMDCITHAKKPFSKGIRECLEKYEIPPEECAIVGDQNRLRREYGLTGEQIACRIEKELAGERMLAL
jgi:HAD superfamily phosphatase (TIGR01668 family)